MTDEFSVSVGRSILSSVSIVQHLSMSNDESDVMQLPGSKTDDLHQSLPTMKDDEKLTKCLWSEEENLSTKTRPSACVTRSKVASDGNNKRSCAGNT